MPQIELTFSEAAGIGFILLVACAIASFVYYRRTLPPVSTTLRYVLTALRGLALFLASLLILEPMVRISRTTAEPPALAILIDNSMSMRISDSKGIRSAIVGDLLKDVRSLELPNDGALRFFTFGLGLGESTAAPPDSLAFHEELTNYSEMLAKLGSLTEKLNLQAAVVLSDGGSNSGENPLYAATGSGIPIFAVGVGDSSYPTDLSITKVVTNHLVYKNTAVPVDVAFRASGFSAQAVEVKLLDGDSVLNRAEVMIGEGTREYSVTLSYLPDGEGIRKFSVRLSQLRGELTTENNRKFFYAKILKDKTNILIVAGSPSPDLVAVRQAMTEHGQFNVQSIAERNPSGFYEWKLESSFLDSADCLILIGFPTDRTGENNLLLIRNAVEHRRIPLFVIGGRELSARRLQSIGPEIAVVPFSDAPPEDVVFLSPLPAGSNHPLINIDGNGGASWDRLPPVFKSGTYRTRPEASTLGQPRTQGIILQEPLLSIRHINKQKSAALLAYGIWRWRLMAQGDPGTENHLSEFLFAAVRWLTTRDDDRPVRIEPIREFFTEGEAIGFIADVYDATARPVENAEVRVELPQAKIVMTPVGNGRYEGELHGLPSGEHSFTAHAIVKGDTLGKDRGKFSIGEQSLEYLDTRMNVELLRQLSHRTGGRFLLPEQLPDITQDLTNLRSFVPLERTHTNEIQLWNWPYALTAIVLLFSVEWLLRKRSGMV